MRTGRKTDQLIHKVVFKQHLDIPPKYSTEFDDTSILIAHLLNESDPYQFSVGYCRAHERCYAELLLKTDFEEIGLLKYESSHCLAICSLALAYFGAHNAKTSTKTPQTEKT